eukprot:COSAG06_NODE_957_length_11322_cov_9.239686_1_plen_52_part_10
MDRVDGWGSSEWTSGARVDGWGSSGRVGLGQPIRARVDGWGSSGRVGLEWTG